MKISRQNMFTGKTNTLDIPISEEQFYRWQNGELIQNVMPELDIELREFLISGFLPGGFDKMFGPAGDIIANKKAEDDLQLPIKYKVKVSIAKSKVVYCCYCNNEISKSEAEEILDENWGGTGEFQCRECWIDSRLF